MKKKFKGKALYQPSGKAAEYSPWAVNFYTGCSNDCDYCYCTRGVMSHVWDNKPHLKKCFRSQEHALRTFCQEVGQNLDELRKKGILFSFTTDPLLPETRAMTFASMVSANYLKVPVKVLTKRADFLDHIPHDLDKSLVAFGFTLTGHDDQEKNASTNEERIKAMKELHQLGYRTWVSIEPVITAEKSLDMLDRTLEFCDLYKVGLISGKGNEFYKSGEIDGMVTQLATYSQFVKIYVKESVLDYLWVERDRLNEEFDGHFVNADYNIFAHDINVTNKI